MPYITEEQYLEIEESAEIPSEYFQGEMFPMEASLRTRESATNCWWCYLANWPDQAVKCFRTKPGSECRKAGCTVYPDLLVVCGKVQVSERDSSSITNPKVIIEILSPSTRILRSRTEVRAVPHLSIFL